jgi:hypothetical protein
MYPREQIYPREIQGRFASLRWLCVFLTQLVFYGLPWINWNERQAVLFDLASRKFYLFGLVLWPQDFIWLAALLIICAFSLFLFTAVAGRVWCGYACPQTVYTEIFLWIERRIEGNRSARMRLDRQPGRSTSSGASPPSTWPGAPGAVDRHQLRRLLHADPRAAAGIGQFALGRGRASGSCSTALPPTAMPAGCASRSASTCAPMPASRAPCSTATR